MSKEQSETNGFGLSSETIKVLKELNDKKNSGEEMDFSLKEALKVIELAGNMVNSVMSGRQIDLAYFKIFADRTTERLNKQARKNKPARRKLNKKKSKHKDKQ